MIVIDSDEEGRKKQQKLMMTGNMGNMGNMGNNWNIEEKVEEENRESDKGHQKF